MPDANLVPLDASVGENPTPYPILDRLIEMSDYFCEQPDAAGNNNGPQNHTADAGILERSKNTWVQSIRDYGKLLDDFTPLPDDLAKNRDTARLMAQEGLVLLKQLLKENDGFNPLTPEMFTGLTMLKYEKFNSSGGTSTNDCIRHIIGIPVAHYRSTHEMAKEREQFDRSAQELANIFKGSRITSDLLDERPNVSFVVDEAGYNKMLPTSKNGSKAPQMLGRNRAIVELGSPTKRIWYTWEPAKEESENVIIVKHIEQAKGISSFETTDAVADMTINLHSGTPGTWDIRISAQHLLGLKAIVADLKLAYSPPRAVPFAGLI